MTTYSTISELLTSPPIKGKCSDPDCPSVAYHNGTEMLCVICDHEKFETCLGNCGQLNGWCNCDGERDPVEVKEERKNTARQILEALVEKAPRRTRDFYPLIDATPMYIDKALKVLWDDELIIKPKHGWWSLPQ